MLETTTPNYDKTNPGQRDHTLVSIITPFYNSGDTLERCIKSVLSQSYSDFEYILADNRSTDGSSQIAQSYAAADKRIRYIHFEEFLPQLPNYNRALQRMAPEARYCKIVQADDYLYPSCVEQMLDLALPHPEIGVVGALRMTEDTIDPPNAGSIPAVSRGADICRATLRGEIYAFGSQTSVMYRADLVRAKPEFFPINAQFADTDAAYDLLRRSDFGFCHQLLTHTTRDPKSLYGRVSSYDSPLLNQYMTMHRIGDEFFTASEASKLKRDLSRAYYTRLARALARRPDRAHYLRFHRSVLRNTAGMDVNPVNVLAAFARLTMHALKKRFVA